MVKDTGGISLAPKDIFPICTEKFPTTIFLIAEIKHKKSEILLC